MAGLLTKWNCNFSFSFLLNCSLLTIKKDKFAYFMLFGATRSWCCLWTCRQNHGSYVCHNTARLLWKHFFDCNKKKSICIKHIIGDESLFRSLSLSTLSIVSRLYQRFCNTRTMSCHFHCAPDEFDALCWTAAHSNWCCSWCCCYCCCWCHRRFAAVNFRRCAASLRWQPLVDCRSTATIGSWRTVMMQFPAAATVARLRSSFVVF